MQNELDLNCHSNMKFGNYQKNLKTCFGYKTRQLESPSLTTSRLPCKSSPPLLFFDVHQNTKGTRIVQITHICLHNFTLNPSTCFPCEEQANESRETSPFIALDKQTKTIVYTREGLKMEFNNYNSVLRSE